MAAHPHFPFLCRGEDFRHRFGMHGCDDAVRLAGQEAIDDMFPLDWIGFGAARAFPFGPDAGEGKYIEILCYIAEIIFKDEICGQEFESLRARHFRTRLGTSCLQLTCDSQPSWRLST
jgi:hypothetical protein